MWMRATNTERTVLVPAAASGRCMSTSQLGCLRTRLKTKGRMTARPLGGAVSDRRDSRLMNAATRYDGKCLTVESKETSVHVP